MKNDNINPTLVGPELSLASGQSNYRTLPACLTPKATIRGAVAFEWFEGGDFLLMLQGTKGDGMPWATWLLGRDDGSFNYTALCSNDRGVSRVYEMGLEKGVGEMWRNFPESSQRSLGAASSDEHTLGHILLKEGHAW